MSTRIPSDPSSALEQLGEESVQVAPEQRYAGDRAVPGAPGVRFVLVLPRDVEGVQATLRLAHETATPVVPRGAGGRVHEVEDDQEAGQLWALRRASRATGAGRAWLG